jgi:hypothetical protein
VYLTDSYTGTSWASTISGSTIPGNTAHYLGGGICAFDTYVSIGNSTIRGNRSYGNGFQRGGGIFSQGTGLTITESTISGNQAAEINNQSANDRGGGVYSRYGDLLISDTTVSGNSADFGGGICSTSANPDGTVLWTSNIVGTTVSNNVAATRGGGIYNRRGPLMVQFSTVTENQAAVGEGGGIASRADDDFSETEVYSSIVAGNMNGDVDFVPGANNSFLSTGYDLIGTGNAIGDLNQPGDQTGVVDPLLGPLADNGGPTKTHALLDGSLAINAGDPLAFPGVGDVPEFDQRGQPFLRMYVSRLDIGAYERQSAGGNLSLVVDTLVDENDGSYNLGVGDVSLREAIGLANGFVGGADVITFHSSLSGGTILLSRGELQITDAVTVNGPGANLLTIDASGNDATPETSNGDGSRVLNIDDDASTLIDVAISGLTLAGGDVNGEGGGIGNGENLSLSASVITGNAASSNGGGLSNRNAHGSMNLNAVTVNGNAATYGGGISNVGNLIIAGSTISDNDATGFFGGGGGISNQYGEVTVNVSTISGNSAATSGGGIYGLGGDLTVLGSTVSDNMAIYGAGLLGRYGSMEIVRSTISGNQSLDPNSQGGGIASSYVVLNVSNSTVSGNTSAMGGGFASYGGPVTINHSTITGNVATTAGGGVNFSMSLGSRWTTRLWRETRLARACAATFSVR